MKNKFLKLPFGNKAIIFTIDVLVGVIIALSFLTVSYLYLTKSVNDLPNLSVLRTGDDIFAVMDYSKDLQTLDSNYLQDTTYDLLPDHYDIYVNITTNAGQSISFGNSIPDDRFVASGKRYSVKTDQNTTTYLTSRYWVWLK